MLVHELVHRVAPEAIALVDHDRRFTYQEFAAAVTNCRDRLHAAGIKMGDRVGIFSRNSAEFVFAYFGIASLGAIAVPINFQLSNREIAFIIKDAGIKFLMTNEPLNLVDAMAQLRCDIKVRQIDIRTCGRKKEGLPPAPPLADTFDEHHPCVII